MQNPASLLFGPEGNDPQSNSPPTEAFSKPIAGTHFSQSQKWRNLDDDRGSISSSEKSYVNFVSKYKKRQKQKIRKIRKAKEALNRVNMTVSSPSEIKKAEKHKKLSEKELADQFKYRELLRKIKLGLEGKNVIPKVPYEVSDVESPPIGVTISADKLTIPPRSTVYVDLKPIVESEGCEGLFSMEGLGSNSFHSVGDALIVKGVATAVQISNWHFDDPWEIQRGEKLGIGRKIAWQALPSMDNVFENEEDYIVNFLRLNPGWKRVNNVNNEKTDLLPSEKSEIAFEAKCKKLENVAPRLVETLRKVKRMFIVEDPGEKFEFMDVPPVSLKTKDNLPETISPLYSKTFTIPEKKAIDQYIRMGLSSGMLERAPDSAYASPLLIIQKRADPLNPKSPTKYRVLVDSRNVNSKCLKDTVFAAPNIDDNVRELGKCKYYSVFDIRSAFHRLKLHEKSRDLTAFLYHGSGELCGVYRYTCLAQGNSNSPHLFVDSLRTALGPVMKDLNLKIHIDDCIIGSETWDQHVTDVIKFLVAAFEANVPLDIAKCEFLMPEVDWCSLRFSEGKVRPSPDRLKCLDTLAFPDVKSNNPKHKSYLRLFGLFNYYRKFIKNYSKETAKVKDYVEAAWDEENKMSFEEAQKAGDEYAKYMCEKIRGSALAVVPEGTEILAYCDASSISVSFSIVRASDHAPIMFGGRSLNKVERTYSSMDRELMSIRLLLEKGSAFITTARSCVVYNDNLSSILNFSGGAHNQLIARSLRLILQIKARSGPNVQFKHLKGIYNYVADALSRFAFEEENRPVNPTGDDKRKVQFVCVEDANSELLQKDENGRFCALVTTRSREKLRDRLRIIHDQSHTGYQKLLKTARQQGISGKGLEQLCIDVCSTCELCHAERRVLCDNILGLSDTPEKEMRTLHIDHVYLPRTRMGNAFALTILDIHSKFFCAIPVPALTMNFVRIAIETFLTTMQTVERVRGDRAFVSRDLLTLCDIHKFNMKFFASHNSRSNAVERAHSTMRKQIESFLKAGQLPDDRWDEVLHLCVRSMNNTVHHTTGHSPYSVVFNKKPHFPGLDTVDSLEIENRRKEIHDKIIKNKEKYAHLNVKIKRLEPGTPVNIRYHSKAPRMPGVIVEDDGGLVAVVRKIGVKNAHAVTRIAKRHLWVATKGGNLKHVVQPLV